MKNLTKAILCNAIAVSTNKYYTSTVIFIGFIDKAQ